MMEEFSQRAMLKTKVFPCKELNFGYNIEDLTLALLVF